MLKRAMRVDNERGATIAFVAAGLAAILGVAALAVDLGMLFKIRSDAQRAADAAALAGASAYLEFPNPMDARDSALVRAFRYADYNVVGTVPIDMSSDTTWYDGTKLMGATPEVVIEVIPDEWKVRAHVRRAATGTWFARIFGIDSVPISAMAAASAVEDGGAKCVKPFALADVWDERSVDDDGLPIDGNGNDFWDNDEEWDFDPAEDHYAPYSADPAVYNPPETGWGSTFRNSPGSMVENDWGREIVVKPQDPQVDQMITPGNFFAWDMPHDPTNTSTCGIGGGGGGATQFSRYICSCNNQVVTFDTTYSVEPGNMKQPTVKGVEDLVALDPGAYWDPTADGGRGRVRGSNKGDSWLDSDRVIKVAIYDPVELHKSGKIDIKFSNIALMFIESIEKKDAAVTARFLTYAQGSGEAGPGGPLVKVLRLVE